MPGALGKTPKRRPLRPPVRAQSRPEPWVLACETAEGRQPENAVRGLAERRKDSTSLPSRRDAPDSFVLGPVAGTPGVPKGVTERATTALVATADANATRSLVAWFPRRPPAPCSRQYSRAPATLG